MECSRSAQSNMAPLLTCGSPAPERAGATEELNFYFSLHLNSHTGRGHHTGWSSSLTVTGTPSLSPCPGLPLGLWEYELRLQGASGSQNWTEG